MMARLTIVLPFLVLPCGAEAVTQPAYRISGIAVSTRDGAPVPYCRMQISETTIAPMPEERRRGELFGNRGSRQQPPEVEADARGHFQIAVDHPGAYVLTGSARDFRRQSYDAHEGFTSSIVLTAATPTVNVVFHLERDAAIVGLVLDEAGESVRNAQVAAEDVSQAAAGNDRRTGQFGRLVGFGGGPGGTPSGFSQTDDRGRYELSGLAPGAYRVRVQAAPWYTQAVSTRSNLRAGSGPSLDPSLDLVYPTVWFPGVEDEPAAEPIRLAGGEERHADFHLTPTPSVHLVIPRPDPAPAADRQPRPQRGAVLTRVSPASFGFGQTSTSNGTTQEFSGLAPGIYEIRTTGPDGRPDGEAKQIRILPGSSGVVDLSTAEVLTKVTLMLDPADGSQAGQITFVDPASGRSINAEGGFGGFGGRRRPDAEGAERERFVLLTQGRWEVHVPAFADTYLLSMQATGATSAGATLQVGEQPVVLTLHLGSGRGEVSGVTANDGKPVQGAMILLVPATLGEPGSVAQVQREETNTDGSFRLRAVVPGKYILLAIDHGWGVKWRDPATLAGYLARGVPVEVDTKAKVKRDLNALEP